MRGLILEIGFGVGIDQAKDWAIDQAKDWVKGQAKGQAKGLKKAMSGVTQTMK
jgi:hypothetical protein